MKTTLNKVSKNVVNFFFNWGDTKNDNNIFFLNGLNPPIGTSGWNAAKKRGSKKLFELIGLFVQNHG